MPRPPLSSFFGVQDDRPPLGAIFEVDDSDEEQRKRLAAKRRQMAYARKHGDLGPPTDPLADDSMLGKAASLAGQIVPRVRELTSSLADTPMAIAGPVPALAKAGLNRLTGGAVDIAQQDIRDEAAQAREELSESSAARGFSPLRMAAEETGMSALALLADPLNYLPVGLAGQAGRAGGAARQIPDDLARMGDDALAQIDEVAPMVRDMPAGPRPPRVPIEELPERSVQRPLTIEEMSRPSGQPDLAAAERNLGMRAAPGTADDLLVEELTGPPAPRSFDDLAEEAMAALGARQADDLPPGAGSSGRAGEIGALRGGEAPIEAAANLRRPAILFEDPPPNPYELTSSTGKRIKVKGTSNVAGLQDDLRQLAEDNVDLLVATRDAPPLHQQLGMGLEEFLATPAGQILTPDQLREGGQLLGGLRNEYHSLARQIGEVADPAAKEALRGEMARLNVESTKLFAVLQGRGYSQGGRVLNEAQRVKEALARDPAMRLRTALLERYQNPAAAPAVAQAEAKAMDLLAKEARRDAAFVARKTRRAATAEELSAEFSALSSDFGKLAGRPRMGLDPELAGLVGKMAKNRLRAGVNTLEEVADFIFQEIRQHLPNATLNDIRATIVSQALAKPQKAQGARTPPARLKSLIPARDQALLTRYQAALTDDVVEKIAMFPDDPADPALLNFLRQMEKPTFRDFRMSYWINSILSGSKTMIRNLSGNAVRLAEQTAMRPIGAVVEAGLARAQGRAPERLLRETVPATVGVFRGIPEGVKRFAFVMKNGYDPERLVAELAGEAGEKFDAGARLPISPFILSEKPGVRAVGTVVTMPGRILEATDALFKVMAQTSENYAWATRKALQEGAPDIGARVAELITEQPAEMVAAGRAFAKRATYQDPMSWVGRSASALRRGVPGSDELAKNLRDKSGLGRRALAVAVQGPQTVGQHLMPFVHISDRVAAGITDYIPLSKPFKTARLLAEKSPEASDLIARQAVGGALGMLGIVWANDGKLVGAAPRDEKLRNDFYAEGKQPYSILMGDRWVPIRDVLGPLAGPFVAAAMYHDHVQVGEDPGPAIAGMTLATARYMLDASYMATLQDVVEAVDQSDSGAAGRGVVAAGARVAGGYNPYAGLQRNVATAMDPRVVEKEGFVDELKAGIPGLRQDLPARIGTLGEELEMSTGAAGGFSPIVPTESKIADPNLQEDVGRLRYTVEQHRKDFNRINAQIKDATRAKDRARVLELRASLPKGGQGLDAALTQVRGLEMRVRKLRASDATDDQKRQREMAYQNRMREILERALGRLE